MINTPTILRSHIIDRRDKFVPGLKMLVDYVTIVVGNVIIRCTDVHADIFVPINDCVDAR